MANTASTARRIARNQRGIASLMVTTVLILVIGLIIIGFSQTTRRNQRETLDRQLTSQAFYAAETAINSVKAKIDAAGVGVPVPEKTACEPTSPSYPETFNSSGTFGSTNTNISVTCLLVRSNLESLYYPNVNQTKSTIVPAISNSGNFNKLVLRWDNKDNIANPSAGCTSNNLPSTSNWNCGYGILRVDLAAPPPAAVQAMTTFFIPRNNPGVTSIAFNPAGSGGGVINGNCDDTECTAEITGLNGNSYYLRLLSVYKDASVTIEAQTTAGANVRLSGQVIVDATGKAGDVLRRVQVRLPVGGQSTANMPNFAIESNGSLCKRFIAAPNFYQSFEVFTDSGCVGEVSGVASGPSCSLVASTHSGDITVVAQGSDANVRDPVGSPHRVVVPLSSSLNPGCSYRFMHEWGDSHPGQKRLCDGGNTVSCTSLNQRNESYIIQFITASGAVLDQTPPTGDLPNELSEIMNINTDPDYVRNPNGMIEHEARRLYHTLDIPASSDPVTHIALQHVRLSSVPLWDDMNSIHLYQFLFTPI
jgi:hypothetical protein